MSLIRSFVHFIVLGCHCHCELLLWLPLRADMCICFNICCNIILCHTDVMLFCCLLNVIDFVMHRASSCRHIRVSWCSGTCFVTKWRLLFRQHMALSSAYLTGSSCDAFLFSIYVDIYVVVLIVNATVKWHSAIQHFSQVLCPLRVVYVVSPAI